MQDPSGLFYRNEKIYVLDAGNSRVLRYTNGPAGPTNGTVTLIFNATDAAGVRVVITNGGGLWVSEDELEAFYTDGTKLKRWKAATGDQVYAERLSGISTTWASPVADAAGNLFFASAGKSYVIRSGPEFKVLAVNNLGDPNHASPAASHGRLFLVGTTHIYCVGKR